MPVLISKIAEFFIFLLYDYLYFTVYQYNIFENSTALPPPPCSATATSAKEDKVNITWQPSQVETCNITSYVIEKLDNCSEIWNKVPYQLY